MNGHIGDCVAISIGNQVIVDSLKAQFKHVLQWGNAQMFFKAAI